MKIIILMMFLITSIYATTMNGFNLNNSLISPNDIHSGGPPRDGIPSIDNPKFVKGLEAIKMFNKNVRAIIVTTDEKSKAYPIPILNWHEIVNDQIDRKKVVITFCPMCGTGIVFDSYINNKKATFGVSGLLYQSDVLLYDRETDSLWSQLLTKSISGKMKGTSLKVFPSKHVNLFDHLNKFPDTLVLSKDTGYLRDYDRNPYNDYEKNSSLYFPINNEDSTYHKKAWSLLIKHKEQSRLITMEQLDKSFSSFIVKFGKEESKVRYNKVKREFICESNKEVTCIDGFWFALKTFYPKVSVLKSVVTSSGEQIFR